MAASFEIRVFRSRCGVLMGCIDGPSGERTEPRPLGEVARFAAVYLSTYLEPLASEWLTADADAAAEADPRTFVGGDV